MEYLVFFLFLYMIWQFTKRIGMYSRKDFSKKSYYIAFVFSNIIYIICCSIYIYTEVYNITASGWWMILLYIGICGQFYSTADLITNGKVKIPFSAKYLRFLTKFMILIIVFLLFAAIRAKYLGYY